MGIAPRQIGWSNESNLLWQISKQLEKLNGVVAATAAGGMLNPTTNYIPFNSGLAFGDSYLVNDTTASVLKTVYSASDIGLKLDFANALYSFGTNDNKIVIDINTGFLDIFYNTNQSTFRTEGVGTVLIGDIDNIQSGTSIFINDTSQSIFSRHGGNVIGLNLDFANSVYWIGDVINGNMGFICEAGESKIGDYNASGNGTVLGVSDSTEQIIASSNLSAPSAGSSSGQFLKIKVGGVDYKIALLNN